MLPRQESATHTYSAGEGIAADASAELHHHLLARALIPDCKAKLVACQPGIGYTEFPALNFNFTLDSLEFLDHLKRVGGLAR